MIWNFKVVMKKLGFYIDWQKVSLVVKCWISMYIDGFILNEKKNYLLLIKSGNIRTSEPN